MLSTFQCFLKKLESQINLLKESGAEEVFQEKLTQIQIQFSYDLKQQGMTYKIIEQESGISIADQKRKFMKIIK